MRAALVAAALLLLVPVSAAAQSAGQAPERTRDPELTPVAANGPVAGRRLHPRAVVATARAVPKVARVLARHAGTTDRVYLRAGGEWQVALVDGGTEIAQVRVDDRTGSVTEAWTGIQVGWPMARGYPGAFGRHAASLPIWLAGLVLFLLPFARPPWRMVHLDLLALCSLSIPFALFSAGHVRAAVPLVYPPLLYLLGRLLHLARHPPRPVPAPAWLGLAIVFLLGFRIGLQIVDANVIDVGYAGVIGADKLAHGRELYGAFPADNPHGDTYGPLLYLAYVPFELIWPWSGMWDDLPAAHAAAAAFDLACAGGLYLIGGRLLAYLWLACPFTLLIANSGTNDALVGALVLAAVARRSGALTAAAAMTKFAPLVLVPLLVRGRRAAAGTALVFAGAGALVLGTDFWDRAIRFQADRDSPFSIWGLYELPALQLVAQAAVLAAALFAARVKHADRYAVAAALLLAVQLTAGHWFYLYLGWVLPVVFVAVFGRSTASIDSARAGGPDTQRTSTAISHGSSVAVP